MGRHRLKGSSSHHPTNRDHPTQPGSRLTPLPGGDKAHEILVTAERFGDEPSLPRQDYFQRTTTKKNAAKGRAETLRRAAGGSAPWRGGVRLPPATPVSRSPQGALCGRAAPLAPVPPRLAVSPIPLGSPSLQGVFWQPLAPRASSRLAPARLSGAGSPHLLRAHTHTLFFFAGGAAQAAKRG